MLKTKGRVLKRLIADRKEEAKYHIAYADCFAAALSIKLKATVVTGDWDTDEHRLHRLKMWINMLEIYAKADNNVIFSSFVGNLYSFVRNPLILSKQQ